MRKKVLISLVLYASFCLGYNIEPKQKPPQDNNLVLFTENKGQISDQNYKPRQDILFAGSDGKMTFHIRNNGISYQLRRVNSWKNFKGDETIDENIYSDKLPEKIDIYRIDTYWKNCNSDFTVRTDKVSQGYSNYYTPVCPQGIFNVKTYEGVIIDDLYTGIDIHYYQKGGLLKHDYLIEAGANYKLIQIEIKGAEVILQADGTVVFKTPLGEVQEGAPIVFQNNKQIKSSMENQ